MADREHFNTAFLYLYKSCVLYDAIHYKSFNPALSRMAEKANSLEKTQLNKIAPDFTIENKKPGMHKLAGDYTLIIFWSSVCWHSATVLPQVKEIINEFNEGLSGKKRLMTIAISADTELAAWNHFIQKGGYSGWINISDFKGLGGKVPLLYNVGSTPEMFLLDKQKKIIAKPRTTKELSSALEAAREANPDFKLLNKMSA
jgi:hypothetical protein